MNNNLFTSKSQDWATPSNLYKAFMDCGFYDPCPLFSVNTDLSGFCNHTKIYINPPFVHLDQWVDYILNTLSHALGDTRLCTLWLLMPSRTDTQYFRKLMASNFVHEIVFITGRLHFNDSKKVAPFPTMLVHLCSFCNNESPRCKVLTLEGFILYLSYYFS